jgi:LysR family transcriptional activator of nhaA
MDPLNYHHLRYFWAVARRGSLTAACKDLHLTPQTVSAQIRLFEQSLGEQLFDRVGRSLALTEAGEHVLGFANEIFGLGQELVDTLAAKPVDRPLRLKIGVVDMVPKLVAERLIEPALRLETPVRIVCREAPTSDLLGELAVTRLDVVLSDSPIPLTMKFKAFNHLLGECGVVFMATRRLAGSCRRAFPHSLNGQPFLLPTETTSLRQSLDQWFAEHGIHPRVLGEFDDSALLKAFGQTGAGVFPVPAAVEHQVRRQYDVVRVGAADGMVERFYAISTERKVKNPAVAAICRSARSELFA